ncbi:MAG: transposase [Candidatus Eremiobacterota bacterium]
MNYNEVNKGEVIYLKILPAFSRGWAKIPKLRMTSIEPVFGQVKEGRGLRQFLLRGLEKVNSLWRIDCAVHNLLKIFRAKRRLQPAM